MLTDKKYLIVIGGPTGSGKSGLAVELALQLECSVISADSRQVYAELNIGTAKIKQSEMKNVPHYLISHKSIHQRYTVGDYESEALTILDEQFLKSNVAILVGGTGLYIKAVLEGIDEMPIVSAESVQYYEQKWVHEGIESLQQEIMLKDSVYASTMDLDNPQRLIRALSVIQSSGNTFSHFRKETRQSRYFEPICVALRPERSYLYDQIEKRVDQMIEEGLEEECRQLYSFKALRSLQTVGYQELMAYFDGQYSLDEAIAKIKQHSRNYAKRQMTWFNNQGAWQYYASPESTSIISEIISQLEFS